MWYFYKKIWEVLTNVVWLHIGLYLSTWWNCCERQRGIALLYLWKLALRFQKLKPSPVSLSLPCCGIPALVPAPFLLPTVMLPAKMVMDSNRKQQVPHILLFLLICLSWFSYHSNRKLTKASFTRIHMQLFL